MKISTEGIKLIAAVEGRRATAYKDTAGKWTIGIGHLIRPDEEWMRTATLTDAQIDELFRKDVAWAERAVERTFPKVRRQNQFDALVSFTFNLGENGVVRGTLDNLINDGASAEEISAKWMEYIYSGGRVTPGLQLRRSLEVRKYWEHLWHYAAILLIIGAFALLGGAVVNSYA
jgi:lysozyme